VRQDPSDLDAVGSGFEVFDEAGTRIDEGLGGVAGDVPVSFGKGRAGDQMGSAAEGGGLDREAWYDWV
jgi:hypothetical protein